MIFYRLSVLYFCDMLYNILYKTGSFFQYLFNFFFKRKSYVNVNLKKNLYLSRFSKKDKRNKIELMKWPIWDDVYWQKIDFVFYFQPPLRCLIFYVFVLILIIFFYFVSLILSSFVLYSFVILFFYFFFFWGVIWVIYNDYKSTFEYLLYLITYFIIFILLYLFYNNFFIFLFSSFIDIFCKFINNEDDFRVILFFLFLGFFLLRKLGMKRFNYPFLFYYFINKMGVYFIFLYNFMFGIYYNSRYKYYNNIYLLEKYRFDDYYFYEKKNFFHKNK